MNYFVHKKITVSFCEITLFHQNQRVVASERASLRLQFYPLNKKLASRTWLNLSVSHLVGYFFQDAKRLRQILLAR